MSAAAKATKRRSANYHHSAVIYLQIRGWRAPVVPQIEVELFEQRRSECLALAKNGSLDIACEYADDLADPEDRSVREQLTADLRSNLKQTVIVAQLDRPYEPAEAVSAGQFLMRCAVEDFCAHFADDSDEHETIIECPDPMLHSSVPAGKAGT